MARGLLKWIMVLGFLWVLPVYGEYTGSSSLIDIPTAYVMADGGFRVVCSGSSALKPEPQRDPAFNLDFGLGVGIGNWLELALSAYTTQDFALGMTAQLVEEGPVYPALAVGVQDLTYKRHISPVGEGWAYDREYYGGPQGLKPSENFSLFAVLSKEVVPPMKVHLGLGRGRFVGYGPNSRYLNTDAFFGTYDGSPKHEWAIGLFGGFEWYAGDWFSAAVEVDGRDANAGVRYRYEWLHLYASITKIESWFWGGERYAHRFAFGIGAQLPVPKPAPISGEIAGLVYDEIANRPIPARLKVLETQIPEVTASSSGEFLIREVPARRVRLRVALPGYQTRDFEFAVKPGARMEVRLGLRPTPRGGLSLSGQLRDSKSGLPLSGEVVILETGQRVSTDPEGRYLIPDLAPGSYTVEASAPGYFPREVKTEVSAQPVELNFALSDHLILYHFEPDDQELEPRHYPILDRAVQMLKAQPGIRVEIQGHTDSVGGAAQNLELSTRRARAVLNYFLRQGIAPERLTARGYGESRAIGDNRTLEGQRLNRRVELVILR